MVAADFVAVKVHLAAAGFVVVMEVAITDVAVLDYQMFDHHCFHLERYLVTKVYDEVDCEGAVEVRMNHVLREMMNNRMRS